MTAKSSGRMGSNPLDILMGKIDEPAVDETGGTEENSKRGAGEGRAGGTKLRKAEEDRGEAVPPAEEEGPQKGGMPETVSPVETEAPGTRGPAEEIAREPAFQEAREPDSQEFSKPEPQAAIQQETYGPPYPDARGIAPNIAAGGNLEQSGGDQPDGPARLPGTQGVRPGGKKVTVVLPLHWHNLLKLIAVEKSMAQPGQEWNISRVVEHALSLYDPRFK